MEAGRTLLFIEKVNAGVLVKRIAFVGIESK
jgi:hypothetical protein